MMFRFIDQLGPVVVVPQRDKSNVGSAPAQRPDGHPSSAVTEMPNWHVSPIEINRADPLELKTHLAALWEHGALGIIILDAQGYIIEANQRTWSILPVASQATPLSFQSCIASQHTDSLSVFLRAQFQHLAPAHDTGCERFIEVQAREDGQHPSKWLRIEVVSRGAHTLALAIEDVSDYRQLIQEKRAIQEQLRHMQRLELGNEWSAGMAHEFNNLLQIIEAYGAIIQHTCDSTGPIESAVNEILSATRRGSTLVKRLLAFSRKSTLQFSQCNLVDLVAHCVAIYQHALASQVKITHHFPDQAIPCTIDQTLIEQAVLNLCVNARDAMPSGGQIRIEVSTTELPDCRINDTPLRAGSYALISVSDTGVGIPGEMRKTIFEPFFTTKKVGAGTGLGLSLVRGIAWDHDGAIDVQSTVGKGSTFTIYLPLVAEAPGLPPRK